MPHISERWHVICIDVGILMMMCHMYVSHVYRDGWMPVCIMISALYNSFPLLRTQNMISTKYREISHKTPWQIPITPHSGTDNLNRMLNYHVCIFIWIRLVYCTPQSCFWHLNHHYLYFDRNSNFTKLPLRLLHEDWSRYNKILHIATQATSR